MAVRLGPGDIDAIVSALRPRMRRLIAGAGEIAPNPGKVPPHTHHASTVGLEPAGDEWTGYVAADDVQEAIEELDDEKLARSGVQPMRGDLNMDDGAGPYQIANIKNLLLTGALGQAVISGVRKLHLTGDDADGEALVDGVERVTFNDEPTKSLIEVLSRCRWNVAVIPGTDYTRAEGDLSWSGSDGLERLVMQTAGDAGIVEVPLGGVYIRVGNLGTTIGAGVPVQMTTKFATWNVLLADPSSKSYGRVLRGVTMQSIGQNQQGWVCIHGYCGGIDLSSFSASTSLFLSDSGGFTAIPPTHGTGYTVLMGYVIKGANPGAMFVHVMHESLLQDLSDVGASGKAHLDVVQWRTDLANQVWYSRPASWFPTVNKDTSYTVGAKDVYVDVDANGADRTVNLPAVASSAGRLLHVKKVDDSRYKVTLDPNSNETIDGQLTFDLKLQWESATVICDGNEWRVI